ncbi:putative ATPase [Leishmania major strain Friedlin]|uniref:Putative ATPase n=1 Tax=Leishmania major TaxID=5664 RepID=Q4QGY8_LEIMA|nr:putative ATPase [Leishmania major strain Friedlin]CAG9570243.1 ATPase_-_putative [Leishmania major strain Friedlin]CAJ02841.1 putative ATPase [Leishmania major strain Friedlin]|eukprot:XP_001681560.1 putative ATPase [Leishmania major strain Friedlin]
MMLTRSQAKRGRSSDVGDEDDSSVVGPVSSDADTSDGDDVHRRSTAKPRSSPAETTPIRNGSLVSGQRGASLLASPQGERLGRGCRVPHATVSLDEQYLAASLRRSKPLQRSPGHRGNDRDGVARTRGGDEENDALAIRSRYPQREAAKRAMENLRSTLAHPNGAAGRGGSGAADDEDSDSNSMGAFNFRHHPELKEEIKKSRKMYRRRCRNRNSASDDDEDESTASSSSEESADANARARRATRGRPRLSTDWRGSAAAPSSNSPAGATTRRARAADADAVSIDSSISDASMRDESVERMAQQDQRAHPSSSSSESGEGSLTRDFMTEAQRRHAARQARESVTENININHYMADAVGVEDSKKVRRRQLDRRYRWLMHQEEDARTRADGYGGCAGAADGGSGGATTAANGALGDISPLQIDDGITFDSVGGLPEHIVTLREMVLLPLLYPDLFERLDLKAPRGVLFVGPPGTGKTLMARALANEGSGFARGSNTDGATPSQQQQQQRITFFVRKGADLLSKWVGESERQLKLLFEEAKRLQPSIIFFDEVDGLAPARHAKAEQTQAALVSTLLALLDGLEDRGQVVVIGATNRPDTLDPALRRPGRFDRELVFPLPDAAARRHILTIQLAKKAMPGNAAQRAALLKDLVEMTEGYTGADLAALCTEASLHRLRTALPQLYLSSQRLLVPHDVEKAQLHVRTEDFYAAAQLMQPSLRRPRNRGASGMADCFLDPYIEVLLRGTRDATLAALTPSWSLVDKALRAGSRDCQDMATAVRSLCTVPIPQPPRPCLLVLRETSDDLPSSWCAAAAAPADRSAEQHQQQRALRLHHLAISLLKGLPRLPQLTVHLPQLCWDDSESRGTWRASAVVSDECLGDGSGSRFAGISFTHMSHVVDSVRQCSPCVVYLSGVEEWLRGTSAEQETAATDLSSDDEGVVRVGSAAASHTVPSRPDAFTTSADAKVVIDGAEGPSPVHQQQLSRRRQHLLQVFRYYLNTMADTDVIFVLPCATAATCELLIGPESPAPAASKPRTAATALSPQQLDSLSPSSPILQADPPSAVQLRRFSARQQLLHPQFSVVVAAVSATPLPNDLCQFVAYVYRIVAMTLQLHHRTAVVNATSEPTKEHGETRAAAAVGSSGALVVDKAPPSSPLSAVNLRARRRADRAQRCKLWRRVEYRRLQLRHVLVKWVSQYINSGKFKLLASADLDLAADNPQFKSWQQHTRHHRIGLQDILEKIEDEAYVCLSQYHDDIDQLVRNVRSFFRTRAAQDQRYRLKALDLKETCLLNMYKLNRDVIRFCEETRDIHEPSSDEDAADMGEAQRVGAEVPGRDPTALISKDADPALIAEQSRRAMSFSQRPPAPVRRKPRRYYGERRRRRKPRKDSKAETKKTSDEVVLTSDGSGDDDSGDGDEEDERASNEGSASEKQAAAAAAAEEEEEVTANGSHTSASGVAKCKASVLSTASSAQDWACGLLASLSYTRLYQVFKSMMRGLEMEVRGAEWQVASAVLPGEAGKPDDAAGVPLIVAGDSERAPDAYAATVFRQLLLAAVGE